MMKSYENYIEGLRKKYGGDKAYAKPSAEPTLGGADGRISGESYREEEIERLINEMAISEGLGG